MQDPEKEVDFDLSFADFNADDFIKLDNAAENGVETEGDTPPVPTDLPDDVDLAAYPQHVVGYPEDTQDFIEAFLAATFDDFSTKGCGVYECIWQFRHPCNEEDVRRISNNIRSSVSRLRKRAGTGDTSVVTMLRFEIMPDRRNVGVNYARTTREVFRHMRGAHMKLRNAQASRDAALKKYF